ncbi:hypothetical protein RM704_09590 [Streptomyces sp. DSM 3412]|uniref:Uncharacterized protein n=1 Tax=Streptomyces gottesmaniae TaxID=3075518 RepID=A0ABU2YWC6_9ACTN|nr:hypothetical protein [Streptomyces sp. DSM 3412]MDT0567719.1 hypothetical protein [Streptomyces sp. DSM 3412]
MTHIAELAQIVPAMLGLLWLVALASNPIAPCGPSAKHPAKTITEHLRAMANHARAVAVLIARKSGAGGDK